MKKELKDLIEISNYFGKNKDYVIAGGGNTSYKDNEYIWVKGSGVRLYKIDIKEFVQLNRKKLKIISANKRSVNAIENDHQIISDLNNAAVYPEKNISPSVETSLHEIINYRFVVHTHPTLVNAVLCSRYAQKTIKELFSNLDILFIPFAAPGYRLFKAVENNLLNYRKKNNSDPKIIFLENHGVIVCADTVEEIKSIYNLIEKKIANKTKKFNIKPLKIDTALVKLLPAIRMLTSESKTSVLKTRNNSLIQHFCQDIKHFNLVSHPFIPDMAAYCRSKFIYINKTGDTTEIITEAKNKIEAFRITYGYMPKVILIKNLGVIAIDNNSKCAEFVLDIYEDLLKVSYYSQYFGGPNFVNTTLIEENYNSEIENFRRSRTVNITQAGRVMDKIIIVTGGAQGFGKGIAENLFSEGANIVIADILDDRGKELADSLNSQNTANEARFFKTDVSDSASVSYLIDFTVKEFGGLDAIISNAGILHAGSLDEMTPQIFELMSKVNYIGYFHCVKYASEVMKLQWNYNKNRFSDIIQINSKSGLKGSNKNSAYAGGKFGGIGLTQSFALELMPFNIKVNSICPGNFFDGPLWDDPKKGLFVQYLKTGKVPGAKSIEDVRKYYESQVPANRGCRIEDVMKAIYYAIEQEYETGQAIPVTGGQIMLR